MVILTLTYILFELSYDNHFPTRNRVFRLYERVTDNTSMDVYGITLRNAYTQLPSKVPEIECAVQLYGGWPSSAQYQETKIGDIRIFYSEKEFFKVFGKTLKTGDAGTALMEKNKAVITASLAVKLFSSFNCLGKSIEVDGQKVMITGVMDDFPKNSHLNFDILISLPTLNPEGFGGLEFQTYYLLKPHVDQKAAASKIASVNNVLMKDWAKNVNAKVQSGVESLPDLYLHSAAASFIQNHGSPKQMIIVGLIAFFVLITALLSYINLFIIQGEKRIAEISIRSLFGASKASIARLFFLETLVVFLIATILAFLATWKCMPYISKLLISKVDISDLFSGWGLISILLVLLVLLGITSGYPVFYLSRMKYTLGLRGKISNTGNNNRFSNVSVFVQFMVAAFFISCTVVILSQLKFMHGVPLGFDNTNITVVNNCSGPISKKYESLRMELLRLPFVTAVTGGEHTMGGGCSGEIIRNTWDSENNGKIINEYRERPGFGELMKLQLIDGRFFRPSMADSNAIIVNESVVRLLGIPPKAGQTVLYKDQRVEIIGVVKDFYYESNPGEPVKPLVIANCHWGTPSIYIKSSKPLTQNQLMQVKTVFQNFDKDYVFTCKTLQDIFDRMYKKENRLAQMVSLGSEQLIIISLISLLALTILKISRRTKEIGIRKVNGITVGQVINSLLKETVIIIVIASLLASAASYLVMSIWLKDYAQRIRLSPGYFIMTSLCILLVAVAATIWQAWRAATRNPAETLRYE
jgi:putative ABC transport system permease protein